MNSVDRAITSHNLVVMPCYGFLHIDALRQNQMWGSHQKMLANLILAIMKIDVRKFAEKYENEHV